ncbi:CheY-like chemotaxis protein [Nitrobacteraceae bacterium AZCC 2146]
MTRILIVEDNKLKGDEIAAQIRSRYDADFEFIPTISGAYAMLEHDVWDLVILDMTFQVSSGIGQAVKKEALAGLELLQYMTGKRIKYPVIVATQHTVFSQSGLLNIGSVEQLHDLLRQAFPGIYRGIVRVDLTNQSWHADLLSAVEGVLK